MKKQSAIGSRPRRAPKREGIVEALRREIARGKFKPGARLPKQLDLAQRFKVSVLTIQRAIDRLVHEGFIETRHSLGTFVMPHPPHLNHYALIFPCDPTDLEQGGWSHYFATLANEATKIQQTEKRRFECFYGIHEPTELTNYQQLVSKARAHQFAGLIFASHPGRLRGTPLLDPAGIPRVGIMPYDPDFSEVPAVEFRAEAWFEKAFDYLRARGRKRIAFAHKPATKPWLEPDRLESLLAVRGLTTRPHWKLPLPLWSHGAQNIIQLLMQSAGERPDALVITDDNVVEPVVAGLMAAGARVPEDVVVVAYANFPRSGPRLLPFEWLGYDNHAALQACISLIDQQCRGEKPVPTTWLAPVFEEELVTRKSATELALPR